MRQCRAVRPASQMDRIIQTRFIYSHLSRNLATVFDLIIDGRRPLCVPNLKLLFVAAHFRLLLCDAVHFRPAVCEIYASHGHETCQAVTAHRQSGSHRLDPGSLLNRFFQL